jgi:chromosome segregation ATPase
MKTIRNMDLPKILLTIVIFTLCLIILQGIQTSAQTPNISGEIEKRIEQTSEAFIELTALLKQASTEISKLNGRLDVLESRERVLQKMYREMTEEMSLLRDLTQRAVALKAGDRKRSIKIEKINRFTGGRPGPRDMMVSVSQFSIAWNQIDTILDKLDEITHQLSLPRSKSH